VALFTLPLDRPGPGLPSPILVYSAVSLSAINLRMLPTLTRCRRLRAAEAIATQRLLALHRRRLNLRS
jgi:hypothetical protein